MASLDGLSPYKRLKGQLNEYIIHFQGEAALHSRIYHFLQTYFSRENAEENNQFRLVSNKKTYVVILSLEETNVGTSERLYQVLIQTKKLILRKKILSPAEIKNLDEIPSLPSSPREEISFRDILAKGGEIWQKVSKKLGKKFWGTKLEERIPGRYEKCFLVDETNVLLATFQIITSNTWSLTFMSYPKESYIKRGRTKTAYEAFKQNLPKITTLKGKEAGKNSNL